MIDQSMTMQTSLIHSAFQALAQDQQLDIITHGATLRLNDLNKRLFLAQSKVKVYEERYRTTLSILDSEGLPDNATIEMHEEYILWHHWNSVIMEISRLIADLTPLVLQ